MTESRIPLTENGSTNVLTEKAKPVIEWLQSSQPTVLAGSGVSIWEPSDLPSGQHITTAIFSALFWNWSERHLTTTEKNLLEKVLQKHWEPKPRFSGMPFEHLMENCPSEDKASILINKVCTPSRPNKLHYALAKGMKEGKIHSIITPNYDCCIDDALQQNSFAYKKVVSIPETQQALSSNVPCYFKIHGSVEPKSPASPMFTLRHEKLLHPDKRKLFSKLVTGRPLLMIGYSGLDFELCPEIERFDIAKLVWNDKYNDNLSMSAERLLRNKQGLLLYGDMNVLVSHWLNADTPSNLTPPKTNQVVALIDEIFTNDEINCWRIRVLNSLGLSSLVFKALDTSSPSPEPHFILIQQGRAHFHAGRYKKARRNFLKAFLNRLSSYEIEAASDAALEASDAYRSYGSPIRAYVCTSLVKLLARKNLKAKRLLKQSLIIRDVIEIANALKRDVASKLHRVQVVSYGTHRLMVQPLEVVMRRKLVECARDALGTGNWIDFQQVSLVAEDLGVDITEIASDEYYLPPKAADGYKHLGYYIPQAMVFTSFCMRNENHSPEDAEIKREWRHHVKTCKRLGINSALWKILAISHRTEIKNAAWNVFKHCEYGYFKGLFDWRKYAGERKARRSKS